MRNELNKDFVQFTSYVSRQKYQATETHCYLLLSLLGAVLSAVVMVTNQLVVVYLNHRLQHATSRVNQAYSHTKLIA